MVRGRAIFVGVGHLRWSKFVHGWRSRSLIKLGTVLTCLAMSAAACTGRAPSAKQGANTSSLGTLSAAWQINGRSGTEIGQTVYDSRRHVLYYVSFDGQEPFDTVRAVNVATGAVLWETYVQGQIDGMFLYENRLVLAPVASNYVGDENDFWILDADTGDILHSILGLADAGKVAGVSDGNVITEGDSPSDPTSSAVPVFTAFSLRTGLETWRAAPDCSGDPVADDSVIAALCGSAVAGLNPTDGSREWRYQTSGNGNGLYLHDGIIEVQGSGWVTFLSEQGRKIFSTAISTQSSGQTPVYFGVVGSRLQFIDQNVENHLEVASVNITTGKLEKDFVLPGALFPDAFDLGTQYYPAGADFAVGAVYLTVRLPPAFLGEALLELNTQDGSETLSMESPQLASDRMLSTEDSVPNAVTVPVKNSAMLIAPASPSSDGLIAYYPSPPSNEPATRRAIGLEGIARQWPSACTLLAPGDKKLLADYLGSGYHALPVNQTAAGLPNASACQYVPTTASAASLTVSVVWDAASATAAKQVLALHASTLDETTGSPQPVPGPWGLAYRIDNGISEADGIAMVVGPMIVEVYDTLRGVGKPFAENLATWLRGQHR